MNVTEIFQDWVHYAVYKDTADFVFSKIEYDGGGVIRAANSVSALGWDVDAIGKSLFLRQVEVEQMMPRMMVLGALALLNMGIFFVFINNHFRKDFYLVLMLFIAQIPLYVIYMMDLVRYFGDINLFPGTYDMAII